jgi:hypothetical protein
MSAIDSEANEPELTRYLRRRLSVVQRKSRWTVVFGVLALGVLAWAGSCVCESAGDPEQLVERMPLHLGRELQGAIRNEVVAAAPSTGVAAHRQLIRVPNALSAAISRDLETWSSDSAIQIQQALPELVEEAVLADPPGFGAAIAARESEKDDRGLRAYFDAHLESRVEDRLAPVKESATAYVIATASAVEALEQGDDSLSPEQMLERRILGLAAQLVVDQ